MVLGFVQNIIAEKIGGVKPKSIQMDFSFVDDKRIDEEDFYDLLELIEEEMKMNLVDHAWRFHDVRQLVEYISRQQ